MSFPVVAILIVLFLVTCSINGPAIALVVCSAFLMGVFVGGD